MAASLVAPQVLMCARSRSPLPVAALRMLVAFAILILSSVGRERPAEAHTAGMSQSDVTVDPNGSVHALVVFSKVDAARLGQIDQDHDGTISPAELEASAAVFRSVIQAGLIVRADNVVCPATLEGGGDTEGDGFGLSVAFACPEHANVISVELPLLDQLPARHYHVLRLSDGHTTTQTILSALLRSASLRIGPDPGPRAAPRPFGTSLWAAFKMGVEHILTGWDHLLFLAVVLLGTLRWRSVVAAISAFTVAHSVTLALAALGVYAPSPRLVEPAIAASIAYVGFENAFRKHPGHRWRVTFVFGLIHGFGFAGALRELTLTRDRLVPTLLGFNLGVEVGQLAVVCLLVPLFVLARRSETFETRAMPRLSIAIGVVGLVLSVVRIVSP